MELKSMATKPGFYSSKRCLQCKERESIPHTFKNGWRLRSGDFAALCNRCASAYEDGKFCETFHSSDDGWRDCESCGKLVHCGCIASYNVYLLLDLGGVICMDCSRMNFTTARNRCLSLESQPGNGSATRNQGKRSEIEPQYRPRVTDIELQQISRKPGSVITPLFEKLLSASDADLKLARVVIPKKCAEVFFPVITKPHGVPIKIQDTDGKEWVLNFRYWPNSHSKMYVLEGLRDYMIATKWQAGDIVKFYQIEPEGKLVIGLKKA